MSGSKDYDFTFRQPTRENVEKVVIFLSFFENPESKCFSDRYNEYDYSDKVKEFIDALHYQGFVFGFDWPTWWGNEGFNYWKNHDLISTADLLTIQKLVTSITRENRFTSSPPGDKDFLRRLMKDDTILKILKRLDQIRSTMP